VEAVKFMKWYTSAAVQKTLSLANKTIPARPPPSMTRLSRPHHRRRLWRCPEPGIPWPTPVCRRSVGRCRQRHTAIWNGKVTPEQGVKDIQTAIETKVRK